MSHLIPDGTSDARATCFKEGDDASEIIRKEIDAEVVADLRKAASEKYKANWCRQVKLKPMDDVQK